MSLNKQPKPPRFQVDSIFFNLQLIKAHIPIKFKCRFLAEIKTCSSSSTLKILGKSKDQYRPIGSSFTFDNDEQFEFSHLMVYDNELSRYKKTEVQIMISLISDSRGDQVKLVGRVRIDLNEFMIDNRGMMIQKQQDLQNCSVKKPQVARLTYKLSLIRQQKMKISQNPNRQAIYAQIDRGVFPDALEYNQFGRQVFGKDFSLINISKINKSFNQGNSIKINDSKLNGSKVESQQDKSSKFEKEEKGKGKSISNESLGDISKEKQQISVQKFSQSSLKTGNILLGSNQKAGKQQSIRLKNQFFQKPPKELINRASYVDITQQRVQTAQQQSQQTQKQETSQSPRNDNKMSALKRPSETPRGKSKIAISEEITQIQVETQQKNINILTQSMFEQQQLIIESLEDQLQQAKEMIEQYKLQMELMKEQTQRLENEKSMHASELQNSRAKNLSKNQSGANLGIALNNELSIQNETLKQELEHLKNTLDEYNKIFTQKEEIISQKDLVINNLSSEIQMAAHQMDLRLAQKDGVYQQLNQHYLLVKQAEIYLKGQVQKLTLVLDAKISDNLIYEKVIDELRHQVQALNDLAHNSPVAQLGADLEKKNQKISELEGLLELQKTLVADYEHRQTDFNTTVNRLYKDLEEQKTKLSKAEQSAKKSQELKEKAEQEMTKAVQKSKTIEKQKYQLSQQITDMNLSAKSLEKLVEQQVHSYKAKYDELALTYEEAQNKIVQLKFAVQSYQSTLSFQQSQSQSQINELTKKLQNFNKKEHLLRQSLDLLENQSTKIRNFVEEKQNRIRDYQQHIRLKDEELIEKNDKINYMERKLRMNENTINDLKLQLKMANAMNLQAMQDRDLNDGSEYETRLMVLNEANSQLIEKQRLHAELIDSKDQTIHELKKLCQTIEPLKHQVSALQAKLAHSEQKCLQLKEQMKAITRNSSQQRSKSEQQSTKLQHAYQQCQKLQQQLNLLEDEKTLIANQCLEKDQELLSVQVIIKNLTQNKKMIENKLTLKDNQISTLKKQLSQMQKLNDELNNVISASENNTFSESNKKQQLLIQSRAINTQDHQALSAIRSPIKDIFASPKCTRTKEEQEIYRLNQELQAYKQREQSYMCNVLDLQEQLEQIKKEKLSSSLNDQRQSIRRSQTLQPSVSYDKKDLKAACDQLEKLIQQRVKNRQAQNLIQIIVANSEVLGSSQSRATNEQGTLFARQKNSLQQKSRILSRQVQKIKALIFKKPDIPYKNKTQIIQMLKPCETITNELIKIGESFARDNEDENEQMSES